MRVGIIGLGRVGTSVAVSVLRRGFARELLLHDLKAELAEGEAMDLSHGGPFLPTARVLSVSLEEMKQVDVVVISAGRNGRVGESRLDLLRDNAAIVSKIGSALRGFRGLLVMVTNPVDVLTHVLAEASGLSPERVFGTGTLLDSARMRQSLAVELGISPHSLHVYVLGEHGDSQVPVFSSARVGGTLLRDWPGYDRGQEPNRARTVRSAAAEIIARKGATNHAIGEATAHLLEAVLLDERRILSVTSLHRDVLGQGEVALSLPTLVGRSGIVRVLPPELDDGERAALVRSAQVLRDAKRSLQG